MKLSLRDYQINAIEAARAAYRQGARAVLLTAPTGAGKTVMFSHITESAAARGREVVILVHRAELLRQTSRALDELGVEHSLIAARGVYDPSCRVHVASAQTLVRRVSRMHRLNPGLIVIDEAHHACVGNTWGKILSHYPEAHILGVTATPERLDGKGLGAHAKGYFEALVEGPSTADLIARGYLSPIEYYAPSELDLSGVRTVAGDYDKHAVGELFSERSSTAARIHGDVVRHYRSQLNGSPAIAFCVSVDHARMVAATFRGAGYAAESIDGTLDDTVRADRIRALGDGRLNVLTSCEIVSEGTDIPVVSGAILLRPTQSLVMFLQQVGRALRIYPGKARAVILDHVGNVHRHGLPTEEREWSLDGKEARKGKATGEVVRVKQCPECYHCHDPAPTCPKCGHVYETAGREVEEVDGELEQITAEMLKRDRRRMVARAKTLEELQEVGRRLGHKPGWAWYVWQARNSKAA